MTKQRYLNNQKGQVLLFVIVAMTIALTVGIAITSRTTSSLSRTSGSNTSARVFSAAEGGIEWFLRQPISVLYNLSDSDNMSGAECPNGTQTDTTRPGACVLIYAAQSNGVTTDNIDSRASIKISPFQFNALDGGSYYWFNLKPGEVKEVALRHYINLTFYRGNLNVCWKSEDPAQDSALYYLYYNDNGTILDKNIVEPQSTSNGVIDTTGGVTAGSGTLEYTSCYTVNINADMIGIRFKSLYAPSKIAVFPQAANFPIQGYKITSIGELDNVNNRSKISKEISAYRSLYYTPAVFDYAIYSQGPLE